MKLSVPNELRSKSLNQEENSFELEADGLLAVCLQHEMDHLQGKVFVEYLVPIKAESHFIKTQEASKRIGRASLNARPLHMKIIFAGTPDFAAEALRAY
jgi:hypothetical protein